MSLVPHYDLELESGMIADFAVYKVPRWDEKRSRRPGSGIEYDRFITEWCHNNLQHSHVVLGRNTGDWAFHVQISHRDDELILREHCEVEEIRESWSLDNHKI
jgi:hypothetical protein